MGKYAEKKFISKTEAQSSGNPKNKFVLSDDAFAIVDILSEIREKLKQNGR